MAISLHSVCERLRSRLGAAPLGILGVLILLTVGAWVLTIYQSLTMNSSMDAGMAPMEDMPGMPMDEMSVSGWSVSGAITFVFLWTVMMVAMMLPAAAPMILIFAAAQARRRPRPAVPTWIFVGGYLLIWAATGVVVYLFTRAGTEMMSRVPVPRATWAPLAMGVTLGVAGVYQLTPLKRVCLQHCRSPFAFVAQHWRDGYAGALAMGVRHGVYCLGCCWALFAVLVGAGMMSIAWMLLITVMVFAEKLFPYGERTSAMLGAIFIAFGLVVASGFGSTVWLG